MELNVVVPTDKSKTGSVKVSDAVFACEFNEPLIHQVVIACLARRRAGTKAQKSRSEVRGGGRKPWRQKGSGRARAGTSRSPIWRSGGVTFAAKPRDYSQKVNKKMYQGAMRSIFSELLRLQRLTVLESWSQEAPKTKNLIGELKQLGIENALIINDEINENLYLSARNIPNVIVEQVQAIDPVDLVNFENIIITVPALKYLEEWLG